LATAGAAAPEVTAGRDAELAMRQVYPNVASAKTALTIFA
jgi:hypothetical protein